MNVSTRPLHEVTHEAIRLLARELGVVDTARFLNQFGAGQGDYTAERGALFEGVTLEELIEEARRLRSERGA
jgi:hypothetical protein